VVQEGSKSHLVVGRPCIARKIGFPELILPNDVRNDLYVNLFSAELSRLNKTADRNVEVCKICSFNIGNYMKITFSDFLVGYTIR
jgi:hypothetical protein